MWLSYIAQPAIKVFNMAFWNPLTEQEFEAGACGKGCQHVLCLLTGGAVLMDDDSYYVPWECQHGVWLMPSAPAVPTACTVCYEEQDLIVELRAKRAAETISWGDDAYLDEWEFLASETPEHREFRLASLAALDAKEDEKIIQTKVVRKEEKWTKGGSMKFRVPRPCKYAALLLKRTCAACGSHVASGRVCTAQVVKRPNRNGQLEARLAKSDDTGVRSCNEELAGCWNHDQHRTCIYVHPDEPQWAAACAGTLRVKEDNRLIFCMAGEERSAAAASAGRFSVLGGGQRPNQGGGGQKRPNQGDGLAPPTWRRK